MKTNLRREPKIL